MDAGGDSGLVVAERECDERDAFSERFEDGIESSMGDADGCVLEEVELRGVADDNR